MKSEDVLQMTAAELRAAWMEVFGEPVWSNNRKFMARRLAWKLQSIEEQLALSPEAAARAGELAENTPIRVRTPGGFRMPELPTGIPSPDRDPRLPPAGTILERKFKGVSYHVEVREKDFLFRGRAYPTLSKVAKEIAGGKWNGFTFFNLKEAWNA